MRCYLASPALSTSPCPTQIARRRPRVPRSRRPAPVLLCPPSRIPPPKLRLKETKPRSLARLVLDLLFPDNSAFVFSEEDEAEFRWYSQHNRDLQERRDRERKAMEDLALATTSLVKLLLGCLSSAQSTRSERQTRTRGMEPSSAAAKGRPKPPRGTVCLEDCRRATELILVRASNGIRDVNVSRYAVFMYR